MTGAKRFVAMGLAMLGFLLLSSCATQAPKPTPSPINDQSTDPSKTQLISEARAVYEHYLDEVEVISEAGNTGVEALKPYVTSGAYKSEVQSFKSLNAAGLHTVGATKLLKFESQSVDTSTKSLVAYACVDLSRVKVLDATGKDVTPQTRPNRQTSLPSFGFHDGAIRLEVNGTWSGESIC